MSEPSADDYALRSAAAREIPAPDLPYRPPVPGWRPRIGLIGAGGIAGAHLDAYRAGGLDVVAIVSRTRDKAVRRRDEFFPGAEVTDGPQALIARPDIPVLDITPHPEDRVPLIEAALAAGKHVLSQKPFVHDVATGRRLADLAARQGVVLAVNQNGRWAPHFAWMREAVRQGLLGEIHSVHASVHWDHGWIRGTPFEAIPDLLFIDFGIHWFDFLASLIGDREAQVFATLGHAAGQEARPPFLGQAVVSFEGGQAALLFDAATRWGPLDRTVVTGSRGTLQSHGPDLGSQTVTLTTAEGRATPRLEGQWFNDGFLGAMTELLVAGETGRPPLHDARSNLRSLELAFAAIASARRGGPVRAGEVGSLEEARA